MPDDTGRFALLDKLDQYLAALNARYLKQKDVRLQNVIVNGVVSVQAGYEHDNWNGGVDGHAITLALPEDIYLELVDQKENLQRRICDDINKLKDCQSEYIAAVFLQMEAADRKLWRQKSGLLRRQSVRPSLPASARDRLWGGASVRVFLSHKANHKKMASELKAHLGRFGIGSFVAHEDIEPTEEWQREIENALFSMDALVALLTEGFHESKWTDQEVGVALGRETLVIPVRLGVDPYGLMGKHQALSGCNPTDSESMAGRIYDLLLKRMNDPIRLLNAGISAFAQSESYNDAIWKAKNVLARFDSASSVQVEAILSAFAQNTNILNSNVMRTRIPRLLKQWTGKDYLFSEKSKAVVEVHVDKGSSDLPF